MPKTSVDKDRHTVGLKEKIRVPRHRTLTNRPALYTIPNQQRSQTPLSGRVSRALYRPHVV